MWEAIKANKRRSTFLIFMMAGVLVGLGYAFGLYFAPEYAYVGVLIAVVVWLLLWMTAVIGGRGVLLASVGAREIQHDDHPVLFNVVEEMTIAAGLPKMPKVYIMDTDAPNAFAVGTDQKSAVAVTSGLLMRLNRDELQGVVAHEIAHIRNQDTRFMMLAGVMMGAIILLAHVMVRGVFFGGGRGRRRSSGRGGGQAQIIIFLVAIVLAILAPLVAQLLYFACSRRREYLADASSAQFTRYPPGLASALEKIAGSASQMAKVNKAVAPMFIINPLKAAGASGILSTHPPTAQRVRILRSMAGGAALADYEAAYAETHGGHLIGQTTLAEARPVGVRAPSAEPEKEDLAKARDAVDILHRMGGYLFLQCACGMKIKVPPRTKKTEIACPRCNRGIPLPKAVAAMAGAAAAAGAIGGELAPGAEERAAAEA
ncbi:MAG: M48 family metalloprotease, partial [Candidatus Brocadiae bacterium]|nr:M48 family metalloprotease [Candidatus Brocadiia bacterium]